MEKNIVEDRERMEISLQQMVGESFGKKFDREGEESDEEKHYYKRDKSRKRRGKR